MSLIMRPNNNNAGVNGRRGKSVGRRPRRRRKTRRAWISERARERVRNPLKMNVESFVVDN